VQGLLAGHCGSAATLDEIARNFFIPPEADRYFLEFFLAIYFRSNIACDKYNY
jgi:hypothetical protein